MEAGPQNNKVAFIIQARMKSERLPGKILIPLPIARGKPLLLWIVEELRKSRFDADIVIATSENDENDILEDFCKGNRIKCFRGDENDVLNRFVGIVKKENYSTIVRLTGDNPLVDIDVLDKTIARHLTHGNDYTKTVDLPVGMNFEIVKGSVLLNLKPNELSEADREHVTLYIKNSADYKKETFRPKVNGNLKGLRLTVDYPSDLLVVSTLFSLCSESSDLRGIALVEKFFREHPYLFEANSDNVQKEQFSRGQDELDHAIKILKKLELNHAAAVLARNGKENSL